MKVYTTDATPVIKSAVDKLVDMVAPTYGPSNNKILIDQTYIKEAVDDGVTIAREFELEDEKENTVVDFIKETAIKTNSRVGDGTTTSLILLRAILDAVYSEVDEYAIAKPNDRVIVHELNIGVQEAVKKLKAQARPIETVEDLKRVCRMSFNNNIADLIAETVFKVGKDGTVTLEESETMETTIEMVEGLEIDRGYISPYMANQENLDATLDNPKVLLYDGRIDSYQDILPILGKLAEANDKSLVIIAEDFGDSAINGMVVNNIRGSFRTVALKSPGFGEVRTELLEDIAAVTGGEVVTQTKGLSLSTLEISSLGEIKKVISNKDTTTLIGNDQKERIQERVNTLKQIKTDSEYDSEKLKQRIAKLLGGVAVVKIGAPTENEIRALKYKAEDSLNAARAAMEDGVVRGAGLSLHFTTSSPILNQALLAPHEQLAKNTGMAVPRLKDNEAINTITGEVGDFFEIGVADPVAVLIAALESAVSTASILITTKGIIALKVEKDKKETE